MDSINRADIVCTEKESTSSLDHASSRLCKKFLLSKRSLARRFKSVGFLVLHGVLSFLQLVIKFGAFSVDVALRLS